MKIKLFLSAFVFFVSNLSFSATMLGIRTVYSVTPVTTSAWVVIQAAAPFTVNNASIFDSCGQTLRIGWATVGSSAGSELANSILIPPGGGGFPFNAPIGARISLIAVSANCSAASTENDTNFF